MTRHRTKGVRHLQAFAWKWNSGWICVTSICVERDKVEALWGRHPRSKDGKVVEIELRALPPAKARGKGKKA